MRVHKKLADMKFRWKAVISVLCRKNRPTSTNANRRHAISCRRRVAANRSPFATCLPIGITWPSAPPNEETPYDVRQRIYGMLSSNVSVCVNIVADNMRLKHGMGQANFATKADGIVNYVFPVCASSSGRGMRATACVCERIMNS